MVIRQLGRRPDRSSRVLLEVKDIEFIETKKSGLRVIACRRDLITDF
jgi:hypothetical protein